ncbi:hypothetical protein [Limibacterium fermenti]|uniref:hypothetical protein n=1 Tax=Limibacterium fermenti TaxID=3229863 RepID=UPI003A7429F9
MIEKLRNIGNEVIYFPFKAKVVMLLLFIISALCLIMVVVISELIPNRKFYKVELDGRIEHIYTTSEDKYYRINNEWYLIGNRDIHLAIGDSLYKEQDSYLLEIYGGLTQRRKFKREVKRLDFKPAGTGAVPRDVSFIKGNKVK